MEGPGDVLLIAKLTGGDRQGGDGMNSVKRPKAKLIVVLGAVVLIQCCCCIIPYSWSARFDTPTFAAPLEVQEENYLSPRESYKAGDPSEGLFTGTFNGGLSEAAVGHASIQEDQLSWKLD
jgi:hypothetical protein